MTTRGKAVYDTTFLAALYYSKDQEERSRIGRELAGRHSKYISAVTIYEVYKLSIQADGKEVADLRVSLLEKDFRIVSVGSKISREAALIWHKHRVPMADAMIAATAKTLNAECVTNDEHLTSMKELKARWVQPT
jgi:predicted nucleic acid-binding protein